MLPGLIGGEPAHLRQMSKATTKFKGPLSLHYDELHATNLKFLQVHVERGHTVAFSLIQ